MLWNLITVIGLVAVALIEAVNEAFRQLPQDLKLPVSIMHGIWQFVPLGILVAVGIANCVALASRKNREKLRLEILSPGEGAAVELMRTVRGSMSESGAPIRLLVFAGDKRWYPQRPAMIDGRAWSAECQFGNLDRGEGGHYQVVAISTEEPINQPVTTIPKKCIRSQIVNVTRPFFDIEITVIPALEQA